MELGSVEQGGNKVEDGHVGRQEKCVLGFQTLCEVKFGPPKT